MAKKMKPITERSGPDTYDGRANMRDPDESDENGKWNKLGKNRPAVIVTKNLVREIKQ